MLTKVTIAKVIRFTHTHTWLNSGTASVSQVAASPLGADDFVLVLPIGALRRQAPSGYNPTYLNFEER